MPNHNFTAGNDTIYATAERGFRSGDNIYAEEGDDTVYLGDYVTFVSGRGNDTVIGSGKSQYATWYAIQPVKINLLEGWAEDGYGYIDKLTGIKTIHLTGLGGEVIGTPADEYVYVFGGTAKLKMGAGFDEVVMYQLKSKDYTIRQTGDVVTIKNKSIQVTLEGVDSITFQDLGINPVYKTQEAMIDERKLYEFTETEFSKGWWYAGVYNQPQLVPYFPQAVETIDIGNDGDLDVILPMNRGYRTGVDSRFQFLVFENNDGVLQYSEALTKQSPFVAGSRRSDVLFLKRDKSEVIVTVAHDTAIETEARFDIPWRFGDLTLTSLNPFKVITSQLITNTETYAARMTGRPSAVDAHSLAIGDINNDGMDDVLVGDFQGVFAMLQTTSGPFERVSNSFFTSLNSWKDPNLQGATNSLLIDMSMGDVNGDGLHDLVVGWGHGKVLSRVFFNNSKKGFTVENSKTLPESVYGADNSLHLKTFIVDINNDGKNDILILHSRYEPYYGGNYIQILIGDGIGNFADETKLRLGDPVAAPKTLGSRLNWTDFWQVIDINNDKALDIVSKEDFSLPFYYKNDGKGFFTRHDILNAAGSRPIVWGDFDSDGRVEILSLRNSETQTANTISFVVSESTTFSPPQASRAYDLAGNAGTVAKILGAVAGKQSLKNKEYVGIGLDLVDKGMSYLDLGTLALKAVGLTTNDQIVTSLWTNIVGTTPSLADKASFIEMLENGFSRGEFVKLAAETAQNAVNIDLVGLAQTGIDYIPVI
jgi:hypothetical protein